MVEAAQGDWKGGWTWVGDWAVPCGRNDITLGKGSFLSTLSSPSLAPCMCVKDPRDGMCSKLLRV